MVFQCINIRQVPREVLKTAASGLGFQHLPRDLANVNVWKIIIDRYITKQPSYISYLLEGNILGGGRCWEVTIRGESYVIQLFPTNI